MAQRRLILAAPSSSRSALPPASPPQRRVRTKSLMAQPQTIWSAEAEKELKKIPFFVRGRARGNTETFARELGLATITVNTLYEAKAHFGR